MAGSVRSDEVLEEPPAETLEARTAQLVVRASSHSMGESTPAGLRCWRTSRPLGALSDPSRSEGVPSTDGVIQGRRSVAEEVLKRWRMVKGQPTARRPQEPVDRDNGEELFLCFWTRACRPSRLG